MKLCSATLFRKETPQHTVSLFSYFPDPEILSNNFRFLASEPPPNLGHMHDLIQFSECMNPYTMSLMGQSGDKKTTSQIYPQSCGSINQCFMPHPEVSIFTPDSSCPDIQIFRDLGSLQSMLYTVHNNGKSHILFIDIINVEHLTITRF